MKCFISFACIENSSGSVPKLSYIDTLDVGDTNASETNENNDQDCKSNDDLHAERFKVKGSFFQEHYQRA